MPEIKKEIKGLKRLKKHEVCSIGDINNQVEMGKQALEHNMQVIDEVENNIEKVREERRCEKEQAEQEQEDIKTEMRLLDKQIFEIDQQTVLTTKKLQRRIGDESDLVQRVIDQKAEIEQKIEEIRIAKEYSKAQQQRNEQILSMKAELEKINKNNASLQFIALQYEREILRRKNANKASLCKVQE